MKPSTVNIAEFKRHMGVYMKRIRAGQTLILRDRNEPVAELKAIDSSGSRLRIIPPRKDAAAFRAPRRIRATGERTSLDALLQDREER